MDKDKLNVCLFEGVPLHLNNGIIINQPTFREIKDSIGYQDYETLIFSMTRFPYEFKFDLEDRGIDYKTQSVYDIFILMNIDLIKSGKLEDLLNFMFLYQTKSGKYENEKFLLQSNEKNIYFKSIVTGNEINSSTIEEIKKVFMEMMFMKAPKERNPVDDFAKELVKMDIEQKRNERPDCDMYSIMDGIVNSKGSSYTYETILDLTPHQIYRSYYRIDKEKQYDLFMEGVYHGTIDYKEAKEKCPKLTGLINNKEE